MLSGMPLRLLLCVVGLAGCQHAVENPSYAPRDDLQDTAIGLLWDDVLGMYDQTPPRVRWIPGTRCGEYPANSIALPNGQCAAGMYGGDLITLPENESAYSDTGLPHELMHAFFERVTGDMDAGHTKPEWTMVAILRRSLAQRGL